MVDETKGQETSGLNWGALVLTSLWLVRNGFLVTFVLYVALVVFAWPLSFLVGVLFFFKGSEWSWGEGRRWKSLDEFTDSQYAWGFVGKMVLIPVVGAVSWAGYRLVFG